MADGWQDLDIQDMAENADKYNFSLWMELFCSALGTEAELSGEKVAEMIIVGSRYKHSAAEQLTIVAREDLTLLFEFLAVMSEW